jgi:hypothetical protein
VGVERRDKRDLCNDQWVELVVYCIMCVGPVCLLQLITLIPLIWQPGRLGQHIHHTNIYT